MAIVTLEKSLLNEMSHIMGNEDLQMEQNANYVYTLKQSSQFKKDLKAVKFYHIPFYWCQPLSSAIID